MNQMQKIRGHLSTINAHKKLVTKLCFACGLYHQGLKHDLSKYSWQELKTGFRYYQGYRSPIDAQKEKEGVSASWLHHKGRNPHHWEYWLDNSSKGVRPAPMPFNYVVEMFCDRVAASMIYQKDKYTDRSPLQYYLDHQHQMLIYPDTEQQILALLRYLAQNGLDRTLAWIRLLLKKWRRTGQAPCSAKAIF